MKLLGGTHGYGDEQHELHAPLEYVLCTVWNRFRRRALDCRSDGGESGLDTGLAKQAAEVEVLQGLLDQGRWQSDNVRERFEVVSRSCIDP